MKRIIKILTSRPFRSFSYNMSKGVTHFGAALFVLGVTWGWAYFHINSSKIQMHNMAIDLTTLPIKIYNSDTIKYLNIQFHFDSKHLSDNTNGKYSSCINVSYLSNGDSQRKDTGMVSLFSIPYLEDIYVDQDSMVTTDGENMIKFKTNLIKEWKDDTTYQVKIVPAKNVKVPLVGEWMEGFQNINIYSNKLGLIGDSPYYNYFIRFDFPEILKSSQSMSHAISFVFGDLINKNDSKFNMSKNITYNYLFPEPDLINNGYILYYTKEKLEAVANNRGIIIQAEDVNKKNKNMSESIIYSVLVGTGAAFLLDILVQLIRELRNLNRRKEEEDAYQELQKTDVKPENDETEEDTIENENE